MCKIGLKQHKQITVMSYYTNAVFYMPSKSESRFTMYPNPDSFNQISPNIHPLEETSHISSSLIITTRPGTAQLEHVTQNYWISRSTFVNCSNSTSCNASLLAVVVDRSLQTSRETKPLILHDTCPNAELVSNKIICTTLHHYYISITLDNKQQQTVNKKQETFISQKIPESVALCILCKQLYQI